MTSTLLQQAVEALNHAAESVDPYEPLWTELIAAVTALESALQQQPEPVAWLPIETAPKDGREVILRNGERVGAGCWVKWPASYDMDGCEEREGGESWSVGFDGDLWEGDKAPTHWQPLPAASPPALQQQEEPREVAVCTLSEHDAHFLACRLRRLFEHFKFPLPDFASKDASLIRIAGSVIGMLLARDVPLVLASPKEVGQEPAKPIMTVAEFCAEGARLNLTAADLALALAARPEFADCLPASPSPQDFTLPMLEEGKGADGVKGLDQC